MKTLVVYYSLEGNVAKIAKTIADTMNADILEIKLERPINPKRFTKFIIGGFGAKRGATPKLMPYTTDLNKYELIIIGTPVWASLPVPAVNTFFKDNNLTGKKIAIFCSYLGDYGKTLTKMKERAKGANIVSETNFHQGKVDTELKAKEWAQSFAKWIKFA